MLPDLDRLNQLMATLGIGPDSRVIAYDDEGGGRAARFALDAARDGFLQRRRHRRRHPRLGQRGHRVTSEPAVTNAPGSFSVDEIDGAAPAVKDYVLARVDDGAAQLFDSRTLPEYTGERAVARRGGHIPGAINLNWQDTMDTSRNLRLKDAATLEAMLSELGFDPANEVITYCQTHHRSAHSYLMLRHWAFRGCEATPALEAEWGNDPSLPVVTGPEPGGLG
ncbi:MAG: rhodanese-like domain-containing protein [Gammaproteobacteria bacterium]|nr:rhodanese-like domain-containing protein [Gammaproteobacteria bacterium]